MLICQELVDGWLGRIKLMIITGSCLIGPDRGEDRASKAWDAGDRGIDKQIFGQVLFSSFCTYSKWRLQLTVWKCSSSYMWVYNHSCRGYISYIQPIVVIAILTYTILYSIICNLNCRYHQGIYATWKQIHFRKHDTPIKCVWHSILLVEMVYVSMPRVHVFLFRCSSYKSGMYSLLFFP